MRRLLYVLCLGMLLSLFSLQTPFAQGNEGKVPTGMTTELQDSLRGAKEPSLQDVLDGLGYSIDVQNDLLPIEVWETIAGQHTQVMLAELAEYSDQTNSGWYCAGSPSDTHIVFGPGNTPPDMANFNVLGCNHHGLFIAPFAGKDKCHWVYYTQPSLNPDQMDHAWIYCSGQGPNEFIVAWEDLYNLGDADYQDLVLLYRFPNRPPLVFVPQGGTYNQCFPKTICFGPITATDEDYCDSVVLRKIQGPGTFEGDSCCFMPSGVSSTYEFLFEAMDLAGAADTGRVEITVNVNQPPQITCPPDDSAKAGDKFISGNFSVSDPKCWPKVRLCGIDPSAAHQPYIENKHVEWQTTCAEAGKIFTICLEVEDECGAKDTCYFDVKVYNYPPQLTCPPDDSVKAGRKFVSKNFSVSDPKGWPKVSLCGIEPPPANHNPKIKDKHVEWQTDCDDAGKTFTICLEAEDKCGAKDTCHFQVKVYNAPPQLVCPDDDSVSAGDFFTSTALSVTDPDDSFGLLVKIASVSPTPSLPAVLIGKYVIWQTKCADLDIGPNFTFTLVAKDPCGAADTCQFTVTVYNRPPEIVCPDDDSVHAGEKFVSTNFSGSDPKCPPLTFRLCGIDPSPTNMPVIVNKHVEWQTDCADAGKIFAICLEAEDKCGAKDTCYFYVTVYNHPPELICPEDDSIKVGESFVSTDYSVSDPDDDPADLTVMLDGVSPTPINTPALVDNHLEWLTTQEDLNNGPDFTFTLIATDPCGAADTCEFLVTVYCPLILIVPEDDSVHAGDYFTSTDFSITTQKNAITVSLCGITPTPVHQPTIVESHVEWQTECADDGTVFTICLEAADGFGAKDTGYFDVTVYNRPPELTCPDDGVVHAVETFVSTDFSVFEPDGDPAPVTFVDITPSATNDPQIVGNHVEWKTAYSEYGNYVIRLRTADHCGLADTCDFTVFVDEPTGEFECPEDDSVHAGNLFVSTNYTLTYPECDPSSVRILSISPPATNDPMLVGYHVEWQTTCDEDGDYVITLITGEQCSIPDTCSFTVTVYNRPPELICPDYGTVFPLRLFVSTDFYFSDPDGDDVLVQLLGIDPPAAHDPVIVEHHVEWQTECVLGDYIITLMAVDECGLADTCEFMVSVTWDPVPDFYIWVYPVNASVVKGESVDYLVELNSMNGFHKPCSLYVYGLPDPPDSAEFDQVIMTPTHYTNMTIYTLPQTESGIRTLTVIGKEIGGFIAHSTQVYLDVLDSRGPSDVDEDADDMNLPKTFALFQNQPNPFNPETRIAYYLPKDCQVNVNIYNVLGQKVKTLFDGYQNAGLQTLVWNGKDDHGEELSSGVYFYRMETGDFMETKKMLLIK